jgi:F-type H+-transporting ATPase subunit b
MLIDWFTVVAQAVNFLILVWLLKRFLFGPIVRHMDAREETIRSRLQEARDREAVAEERIAEFRRRQQGLEEERGRRLAEVEEEAEGRRHELLAQAREAVDARRQAWLQSLERERQSFGRELRRRTADGVLEVAGRALKDLADSDLQSCLVATLLERLQDLAEEDRRRLHRAAEGEGLTVVSCCELDAEDRRRLTRRLHQVCGGQVAVDYRPDPDRPLGVEVRAGSFRLGWGVDEYLEELRRRILERIEEQPALQKSRGGQDAQQGEEGSPAAGGRPEEA